MREVTFPHPGWAAYQQVALLTDVVTGGQGQYPLAIEGRVEGKVKSLQRLGGVDVLSAQR